MESGPYGSQFGPNPEPRRGAAENGAEISANIALRLQKTERERIRQMGYTSTDIRNVCLVGPRNAGKTQLTEALLHAGGKIPEQGAVEKGTTVSDYTQRERDLGHSQYVSVCHLDHGGIHVNLIDTPGYRDFYGRAVSVLPAVETAAVVINADGGVEMIAQRMMNAAKKQRLCRMIIINKIDAEGVNLDKLLQEIRSIFGPECLPLNLPSADGEGVVDCFLPRRPSATSPRRTPRSSTRWSRSTTR
jgi:elongation factor G